MKLMNRCRKFSTTYYSRSICNSVYAMSSCPAVFFWCYSVVPMLSLSCVVIVAVNARHEHTSMSLLCPFRLNMCIVKRSTSFVFHFHQAFYLTAATSPPICVVIRNAVLLSLRIASDTLSFEFEFAFHIAAA